jgi:hypothetical protein
VKPFLTAAARFVGVSGAAFAAATAWPALVLAPPAWLACVIAPLFGLPSLAPPSIAGATITFDRLGTPLPLEDPYVLAGIPLHLGLWALARRPWRSVPWVRIGAGVAILLAVAGFTLALVALCVDRGFTTSPAREPVELVALAFVAAVRVLPLPLWMMLDPERILPFAPRAAGRNAKPARGARGRA